MTQAPTTPVGSLDDQLTARLLHQRIIVLGQEVEDGIAEMEFGAWDGLSFAEVMRRRVTVFWVSAVTLLFMPFLMWGVCRLLGGDPLAQALAQVMIPLTLPVLLAAVRIVLVQNIGLAVIAGLVGGGGLGVFVFQGISQTAPDLVLLGALPTVALAVADLDANGEESDLIRQLDASAGRLVGSKFPFGERYVVVNIPGAAVEAVPHGVLTRQLRDAALLQRAQQLGRGLRRPGVGVAAVAVGLADVVEQQDPVLDQPLRPEVGVAAGGRAGGVEHRGRTDPHQCFRGDPVDVDVVDDGDVPRLQALGERLRACVDPDDAGPGASVASGWVDWTFDCVGSG